MIPFNLITGFLGSGKTTLLGNLLNELSSEKRIAIIQNEFAPSGIDGRALKRDNKDFKLLEINNGSVFCVCQLSNFIATVQKLITEYEPEIIFLEASGLSDPISIIELLQAEGLAGKVILDKCICLVDVVNFFKGLHSLVRFKHQLMIADKIICNKTDLFKGDISEINNAIRALNPYAEIILTSYANIPWDTLETDDIDSGKAAKRYSGIQSLGRPDLNASVLRSHDRISEQALKAFILELQKTCLRIKGYLNLKNGQTVSLQSVYDHLEMQILETYTGPTELIAFGTHLSVLDLRKTYKKYVDQ